MQPDTAIYNSVLRLVAAEGEDPDALEEVVADMVAHGAAPDRRSYFLLLRGHTRAGDLFGAKRVMQRMATDGSPSLYPPCPKACAPLRAMLRSSVCK
jgi:hypothetical protein